MTGLQGRRALVTRPRAQAAELCAKLEARGAHPVVLPVIEIAPVADPSPLDHAAARLNEYAWVVFTSVNGVAAFWDRLLRAGRDATAFAGAGVAAIGPATARALEAHGIAVRFIPDEYVAERILDGLGDVHGRRVLLPRADLARRALAEALVARGARVDEVVAYRTLPAAPDAEGLAALRRGVDAITFTSASAVRNFVALAGRRPGRTAIACIGPVTAQAAREEGVPVDLVAEVYTLDGLVEALEMYFERLR